MPITYQKGDLFRNMEDADCILHVCNDINAWGAGFVVPLGKYIPVSKESYHRWFTRPADIALTAATAENASIVATGPPVLGNVQIVQCWELCDILEILDTWVVNMIAQSGTVSADNTHPLKYDALLSCLQYVKALVPKERRIIAPKFGAGLAGGDWNIIAAMLESVLPDRSITVFEL